MLGNLTYSGPDRISVGHYNDGYEIAGPLGPSAVLKSPHEAQLLVIEYAKLLSDADRMLARIDVCAVTAAGTVLEGITPSLLKGSDTSNSMLASFLSLVPCCYVDLTSGTTPAALAQLKPDSTLVSDPVALVAVKVVSAFRDTQADPPFDHFVPFAGIISELMRRRQNIEEGRFAPLFASHWNTSYTTFTAAFPAVSSAWEMTRAIKTLYQSADITLSFTPHGLDGLCIRLKGLLMQLEVESPGPTSSTEDRISSLLTLLQLSAASKIVIAESEKMEGDEKYDKLLADPKYADLLFQIVAVNTSEFDSVDALRIACNHELGTLS